MNPVMQDVNMVVLACRRSCLPLSPGMLLDAITLPVCGRSLPHRSCETSVTSAHREFEAWQLPKATAPALPRRRSGGNPRSRSLP
ncbi:hypothetical protein AK812_SmicGene23296 [Symbiodinium microadriaticum]|uniref:Uncharacterized protein n=1 Tax=Symbiodinium microadriaticum TaxID=2951 RepID=A0A1Q9DHJ8_SYMMI|nr:hypothetical protein AK812_SmicGene23296 [Symbiodinium microadriaticum]